MYLIGSAAQSVYGPFLASGSMPGGLQTVIFLVCCCMSDIMTLFKKRNDGMLRHGKGGQSTYSCRLSVDIPGNQNCHLETVVWSAKT